MRADVKACLHIFKRLSVAVLFFSLVGVGSIKLCSNLFGCHLARDWDICCCDLAPISVRRREADSPPHLMSCLVKLSSTSSLMTAWLNPRLTFGLVPLHRDLNILAKSFSLICVSFFWLASGGFTSHFKPSDDPSAFSYLSRFGPVSTWI